MANDEELLNGGAQENAAAEYTDDNIVTLEGLEHVRLRPGMYIGKLGDGNSADDGIYVLLKEVIDYCTKAVKPHILAKAYINLGLSYDNDNRFAEAKKT